MNYWGFDGKVHRGNLIVNADSVSRVIAAFTALYSRRFPIASMRLMTGWSNFAGSRNANNTSAFVCQRTSAGAWDTHAEGRTIDLNPVQNPFVSGTNVYPASGRPYANRSVSRPGMISSFVVATFNRQGWRWSGSAAGSRNYQWLESMLRPPSIAARVESVSAAGLRYSYRSGCPVRPSSLRRLVMNYTGWDGRVHRGELIVRSSAASPLARVFARAYGGKFPIRAMTRVDTYLGSDPRSMEADNTSAFNCRKVTGNPYRLSQHSYGNAIDINPRENPYVTSSRFYPPSGAPYLRRSPYRKGMITYGTVVASGFRIERWPWGARWRRPDYQHFSSNGG